MLCLPLRCLTPTDTTATTATTDTTDATATTASTDTTDTTDTRDTTARGVLPIIAYTGRLRPKGVPFSGFRYITG